MQIGHFNVQHGIKNDEENILSHLGEFGGLANGLTSSLSTVSLLGCTSGVRSRWACGVVFDLDHGAGVRSLVAWMSWLGKLGFFGSRSALFLGPWGVFYLIEHLLSNGCTSRWRDPVRGLKIVHGRDLHTTDKKSFTLSLTVQVTRWRGGVLDMGDEVGETFGRGPSSSHLLRDLHSVSCLFLLLISSSWYWTDALLFSVSPNQNLLPKWIIHKSFIKVSNFSQCSLRHFFVWTYFNGQVWKRLNMLDH